ncbi:ATP-dependent helicase [Kovacikia minuta CCNUW1]|uniref:ATP-dependent helicase n=1 Tax=Kovacikia minuta TaxID=2931930 RepID=UPI001CCC07A9|nr:ATP-dependent helicase [Kovacikia minuta]UBF29253.1 ATP-dependent helicase [Kovacikia minuta CCNUW1]
MSSPPFSLDQLQATLRPGQREIADWQGGPLAVAAVPGSGKSTGMAVAAAIAIARHQLNNRRQLIVVTFTRSAAANIKAKIRGYLRQLSLPPGGFTVQTLHGLAWAIARAHPELSGLNQDSVLVTLNQSHRLIRTCVEQWISANSRHYQRLIEGRQFDGEETERLRRQTVLRTELLPALASTVIHEAKSSGLLPADLRRQSQEMSDPYAVLAIAAGLYEFYQTQLQFRNLIDYDEMILGALRVLEDPAVRQYWQNQVFAVFEDEAQDSSPLQTRLLEILAVDPTVPNQQNLVRVGDPNQAINSTFTPADPIYFREFCEVCRNQNCLASMTQAGRSTRPIIDAANFVLRWVNGVYGGQKAEGRGQMADGEDGENAIQNSKFKIQNFSSSPIPHPSSLPETPFSSQMIHPVSAGDPQPDANPIAEGRGLELYTPEDVYQTVEWIGQRAIALFQKNPQGSAAVLVRTNEQGRFVARELYRWHLDTLPVYEVGQRDRQSHVPAELLTLLQFCDRPHSPDYLKAALTTLVGRKLIPTQDLNALVSFPEQFLYPGPLDPPQSDLVAQARHYCTSLLRARLELPPRQLIPFLALTLDYDQTELATADKLAERVAQQALGENTLPAILSILAEIVTAEQFEPVEAEDGEERYTRPGQLTVITMHKAKGLDWDYVFVPFLHENMIPGTQWIPPQMQFLGDFTLAEVARAQIRAYLHNQFPLPDIETAWERAKTLKTAEEFRLLYVAMTRAKRLLWMSAAAKAPFTWNKPENLDERNPCPVFPALQAQFPDSICL